jgi:hypothetical protein
MRALAKAAATSTGEPLPDSAATGRCEAEPLRVRQIKTKALDLACTTAEIHDRTVRFKNGFLVTGAVTLAIALIALIAAAAWVLLTA